MNSLEAKIFTQETASKVWKQYKQAFNCGELPPIEFTERATRTAGFAYYSGKVSFNLTYLCSHPNQAELEDLIAHELAHIVQYRVYPRVKQAHGPEFRLIMQLIGYSGRTYHAMSKERAKQAEKQIKDETLLLLL